VKGEVVMRKGVLAFVVVVVGVLLATGVWGSLVASLQTSLVGYTPPI